MTERKWYYSAQPRKLILLVATISHIYCLYQSINCSSQNVDLIHSFLTGERKGLVCIEMPHHHFTNIELLSYETDNEPEIYRELKLKMKRNNDS